MSLEDESKKASFGHAKQEGTYAEQAPVRARYEQSHPAKSDRGDPSISSHPWPRPCLDDAMDLTHAATSITDAGASSYSYDSTRDLTAYFREIDGRKFSSRASTYMLPADETEFWRLDKQHAALLVGLGGLYACPDLVERVLAPRSGETIEILDLGCGTGTWALSMAQRFPHAQVLGIDIAPTPLSPEQLTPNISFMIEDINLGLSHYTGRFDLVHMRCVGGGLPNYAQGITYAARCVKPGGVLLVADLDLHLCGEDMVSAQKMATPDQPDGSWLQRFLYEFRWAYAANGTDIFQAEEMLDNGLWGHQLLDACGAGSAFIPVGPWAKSTDPEESQRLQFGGVLMRQNLRNGVRSFQSVMKKNGVPQNVLDEWILKCGPELDELKLHSWMRLRLLWGQRNNIDASAPAPPTSDNNSANTDTASQTFNLRPSTWEPHQQIHVYHTAEESQNARKLRLDTTGNVVEPVILASP